MIQYKSLLAVDLQEIRKVSGPIRCRCSRVLMIHLWGDQFNLLCCLCRIDFLRILEDPLGFFLPVVCCSVSLYNISGEGKKTVGNRNNVNSTCEWRKDVDDHHGSHRNLLDPWSMVFHWADNDDDDTDLRDFFVDLIKNIGNHGGGLYRSATISRRLMIFIIWLSTKEARYFLSQHRTD